MVIAVGQPPNDRYGINTADLMLQQWGKRIWTFPEVLLAPAGKDIQVYPRGGDLMRPLLVPKNQFAAKVWKDDANVARQVSIVCAYWVSVANLCSSSTTMKAISF